MGLKVTKEKPQVMMKENYYFSQRCIGVSKNEKDVCKQGINIIDYQWGWIARCFLLI